MDWLNYHHLFYFWVIAREGSIKRACEVLSLSQPALSAQLRALENAIGEKLFSRTGRGLILTDTGTLAYRYAGEIFSLGKELTHTLKGQEIHHPVRRWARMSARSMAAWRRCFRASRDCSKRCRRSGAVKSGFTSSSSSTRALYLTVMPSFTCHVRMRPLICA